MSPGLTFERVYRELKRRLGEGILKPGDPIEPAAIGADLGASITPIRDALHRLVGERLVETPQHNGFAAPRLTETELRDLYAWNGQVIGLAVVRMRFDALGDIGSIKQDPQNASLRTATLFLRFAEATGSAEHVRAIARLNDRLAPCRHAEAQVLNPIVAECDDIIALTGALERTRLKRALIRYHQRRMAATPAILAGLP